MWCQKHKDTSLQNHKHVLLKASWLKHNTEEMTLVMMRNKAKSLNIAVIMKSKVMGSKTVTRIDKTTLKQAMMRVRKHKK